MVIVKKRFGRCLVLILHSCWVECRIFRVNQHIGSTLIICFTVRVTSHTVHWGGSYLAIRNWEFWKGPTSSFHQNRFLHTFFFFIYTYLNRNFMSEKRPYLFSILNNYSPRTINRVSWKIVIIRYEPFSKFPIRIYYDNIVLDITAVNFELIESIILRIKTIPGIW